MTEPTKLASTNDSATSVSAAIVSGHSAPTPKKEEESDFPFAVAVGNVYEGPLDLLLDLIRKQDIDIYDIPMARITAQYLAYVEKMRDLDVNVAAEFIYMAAVLIHIHAASWLTGCWSMRSSSRRHRCFCRSSRSKTRCCRIHR